MKTDFGDFDFPEIKLSDAQVAEVIATSAEMATYDTMCSRRRPRTDGKA